MAAGTYVLRRSAGSLLLQPPAAGAGAGALAGVVDTKGCAIRAKRLVLSAEYLPASATTEAARVLRYSTHTS
jgi:hypothetical protein